MIREANRLKRYSEIPTRNSAFLQKRFGDAIDRCRRNRERTETRKPRRGDADDLALRVSHGTTSSCTPDHQSDATRFDRRGIASLGGGSAGVRTLQNRKISRRITSC